jgi:hypothetical protein
MMKTFTVAAGGGVPVGIERGIFSGAEEAPPHADYGIGMKLNFTIAGGTHDGMETSTIVGIKKPPTPQNRLGQLLGGLAGSPVQAGQQISLEPFIGKTYLLTVEAAPSGKGTRVGTIMPCF